MLEAPENTICDGVVQSQWSSYGRPEALFVIGGTTEEQHDWIVNHKARYYSRSYPEVIDADEYVQDDGSVDAASIAGRADKLTNDGANVVLKGLTLESQDHQKAILKLLKGGAYNRVVALDGKIGVNIHTGYESMVSDWNFRDRIAQSTRPKSGGFER